MNKAEGLARVAAVIRWSGHAVAALTGAAVLWVPFSVANDKGPLIGMLLFMGAVYFIPAWALAWIVDGFAKKPAQG